MNGDERQMNGFARGKSVSRRARRKTMARVCASQKLSGNPAFFLHFIVA
jgi:hypothetical protein